MVTPSTGTYRNSDTRYSDTHNSDVCMDWNIAIPRRFQSVNPGVVRDQSCPWVGLAHGLDWAASDWVEIFQTSVVGCVGLGRH